MDIDRLVLEGMLNKTSINVVIDNGGRYGAFLAD